LKIDGEFSRQNGEIALHVTRRKPRRLPTKLVAPEKAPGFEAGFDPCWLTVHS
jgi:hypothetical protein